MKQVELATKTNQRKKPKKLFYSIQFIIIFIIHFILLYWIYYALSNLGEMSTATVMWHFAGMATMGALLIYGCAKWAKYHFVKDTRNRYRSKK